MKEWRIRLGGQGCSRYRVVAPDKREALKVLYRCVPGSGHRALVTGPALLRKRTEQRVPVMEDEPGLPGVKLMVRRPVPWS